MFGRTEPQGEWKLRVPRDRTGSPAGKAGFWGGRSGRGAVFPHLLLACSCVQLASDVAGFGFRGIPKLVLAHWRVGLDPRMAGWLLVNQRYFRPEVTCLWAGWSLGVLRPWSACWCVDWILRRQARGLLRPCSWCILVAKWGRGPWGITVGACSLVDTTESQSLCCRTLWTLGLETACCYGGPLLGPLVGCGGGGCSQSCI